MRVVITRVLPVPAPASTSSGPSVVATASRWAGLRDARSAALPPARAVRGGCECAGGGCQGKTTVIPRRNVSSRSGRESPHVHELLASRLFPGPRCSAPRERRRLHEIDKASGWLDVRPARPFRDGPRGGRELHGHPGRAVHRDHAGDLLPEGFAGLPDPQRHRHPHRIQRRRARHERPRAGRLGRGAGDHHLRHPLRRPHQRDRAQRHRARLLHRRAARRPEPPEQHRGAPARRPQHRPTASSCAGRAASRATTS